MGKDGLMKRKATAGFFKCPKCGHLQESLVAFGYRGKESVWKCFKCGFATTDADEFKLEERVVWAFRCVDCGDYVADTNEKKHGALREVFCGKHAFKDSKSKHAGLVAINGKHVLIQEKISHKDLEASEKVNDDLFIFTVKTKRQ